MYKSSRCLTAFEPTLNPHSFKFKQTTTCNNQRRLLKRRAFKFNNLAAQEIIIYTSSKHKKPLEQRTHSN